MLFHFAGEDSNPGPDDMATLAEALQQQAIEHEFHVYDGVNHGFSCVDSSAFDREASDASWQRTSEPPTLAQTAWPLDRAEPTLCVRTVAWLDRHLQPAPSGGGARRGGAVPPAVSAEGAAGAAGQACTGACAMIAQRL